MLVQKDIRLTTREQLESSNTEPNKPEWTPHRTSLTPELPQMKMERRRMRNRQGSKKVLVLRKTMIEREQKTRQERQLMKIRRLQRTRPTHLQTVFHQIGCIQFCPSAPSGM